VSDDEPLLAPAPHSHPLSRKQFPSQRLSIPKSWTKLPTSPRMAVLWILGWVPLTGISSAKHVVREWRSARGILGILSWRGPSFILVRPCASLLFKRRVYLVSGFIVKVKKILECICVNCGKLKADIVSRVPSFSSTRFAPHHPIFWGLSPHTMVNPKPTPRQSLDNEGALPPGRGTRTRVFGRLIAASIPLQLLRIGWARGVG